MQPFKIPLGNGDYVIVDADDYEFLNQFRWFKSTGGYACRQWWETTSDGKKVHRCVFMHRVVNKTPDGMFTDHVNGNKRDNRKSNLRTCNKAQNSANRPKIKIKNACSQYKGVSFHPSTGLYRSRLRDGSYERTTYHKTPEQAALDYNRMAKERFGEFAHLNFVLDGVQPTQFHQKTSKFRGVRWHKKIKRWIASIDVNGRTKHISSHTDELEAAKAYNARALELRGDKAKLNQIPEK